MRDEKRRRRFLRYFEERLKSDRQILIERTGMTKGRITQLLDPEEPFGELAGRNLARKLGLAPDYFESDHVDSQRTVHVGANAPRPLTAEEIELLRLWEPLLADQRDVLLSELQRQHTIALKTIEEVRRRGYDKTIGNDKIPRAYARPDPPQGELLLREPPPGGAKEADEAPMKTRHWAWGSALLVIVVAGGMWFAGQARRQAAMDETVRTEALRQHELRLDQALERDRMTYLNNRATINNRAWEMVARGDYVQAKTYAEVYLKFADDELKRAHEYARIGISKSSPPKIGMTAAEARASAWGEPRSVNRTTTARGEREQWVYSSGYLYLDNGRVVAIQE